MSVQKSNWNGSYGTKSKCTKCNKEKQEFLLWTKILSVENN